MRERVRARKKLIWSGMVLFLIGLSLLSNAWASNLSILHYFGVSQGDGLYPNDSLVADTDGNTFYGMTYDGGSGGGVIFKINKDGTQYNILHSFDVANKDGYYPHGSLLLSGSILYGMTSVGGDGDSGVIFKINTDGTQYTILHSFKDGTVERDGANPHGNLVLYGSTLYGMTSKGDGYGSGMIFKVNADGTDYDILHWFGSVGDAKTPYGSLVLSGSSTLYGMTSSYNGGVWDGAIFKINTDGTNYNIIHVFGYETIDNDGKAPHGNVLLAGPVLYGMTSEGGKYGNGVIFKSNIDGTNYTILHSFGDEAIDNDGTKPYGSLVRSPDGSTLYGMTSRGGTTDYGAIFSIKTDGTNYTILNSFNDGTVPDDGAYPQGSPILSGSALYGMTYYDAGTGGGTVFKYVLQGGGVPGAPTGVSATAGNAQATVSFTPPASDGGSPITSYTVTSNPGGITKSGAASPITVTGLTNGTTYTFTVKAINANGTGPASNPSNSVTPLGRPGAPTGVSATAGNAQATVSFTPPASDGGSPITSYTVTSNPGGITKSGAASPITVTGLTNGTAYTFTVKATNEVGTGPASSPSNSVTPGAGTPGAPTGVSATAGNARATVSFTPPASDGGSPITSYTVTSNPGGITKSGTASPITITGLTNGTAYTFTVKATNANGTGPASSPSNSVTPLGRPGAPTGVSATAGNAQATVSFTPPASDGGSPITSYTVTSNPGGITKSGAASPITVTGLTNGTAYTFTVKATNKVGTGPASSPSNSVTPAEPPDPPRGWVQRYNGTGNSSDYGNAIAVDDAGNVYVTGTSYGGTSRNDYATIKYDTDGNQQWLKRYNGTGNSSDYGNAIAVDGAGNVYVTGTSDGGTSFNDYATIKYDTDGNQQWVKRYNYYNFVQNFDDYASAIAVDGAGNVYVTGCSRGGNSFVCVTIKYDTDGKIKWVKYFDAGHESVVNKWAGIAVDSVGNVYVTSSSNDGASSIDYKTVKYDTYGNEQWVKRYNGTGNAKDYPSAIAVEDAGNVYVTGSSSGGTSFNDYATIKYDTNGNEQWVQRYNGTGNSSDYASAIAVDGAGNVYVTGSSTGKTTSYNYATIKYDTDGHQQWVKSYKVTGTSIDYGNAIAVDGAGSVYVTGSSTGFTLATDYATIKYDTDGNQQWVKRYNGTGNSYDYGNAIAVDGAGNVYVTGSSGGKATSSDYATMKIVP